MAIRDALLPEFDHEMATTRKTLERVPEGKPDWKPHDKSMTMGRLAGHVAELPSFVTWALEGDSFDINPAGGSTHTPLTKTRLPSFRAGARPGHGPAFGPTPVEPAVPAVESAWKRVLASRLSSPAIEI
jgi:hypothetical protein